MSHSISEKIEKYISMILSFIGRIFSTIYIVSFRQKWFLEHLDALIRARIVVPPLAGLLISSFLLTPIITSLDGPIGYLGLYTALLNEGEIAQEIVDKAALLSKPQSLIIESIPVFICLVIASWFCSKLLSRHGQEKRALRASYYAFNAHAFLLSSVSLLSITVTALASEIGTNSVLAVLAFLILPLALILSLITPAALLFRVSWISQVKIKIWRLSAAILICPILIFAGAYFTSNLSRLPNLLYQSVQPPEPAPSVIWIDHLEIDESRNFENFVEVLSFDARFEIALTNPTTKFLLVDTRDNDFFELHLQPTKTTNLAQGVIEIFGGVREQSDNSLPDKEVELSGTPKFYVQDEHVEVIILDPGRSLKLSAEFGWRFTGRKDVLGYSRRWGILGHTSEEFTFSVVLNLPESFESTGNPYTTSNALFEFESLEKSANPP